MRLGSLIVLLVSIALFVINHVLFFGGYFGYDDMHYARLSYNLLHGEMDFADHYSYRWPVLGFTALSYALFGVSDFATALPSLLLSLGILFLVYWHFKHSVYLILLSILLCCSIKWHVFYSDKITPDIYVSFFLFLAWSVYTRFSGDRFVFLNSIIFASSLFLAFLSKGTVLLIIPLLAFYFFRDFRKGDLYKWKYSIPIGLALLVAYLLLCYALTGDPLARFHAISENSYFSSCSYDLLPRSELIHRISLGFIQLAWKESLLNFLIFAVLIWVYGRMTLNEEESKRKINMCFSSVVVLFLSLNFMTFSLTSYSPGCLDLRHYLFSVPIMSVCLVSMIRYLKISWFAKTIFLVAAILMLKPTIDHKVTSIPYDYPGTKQDLLVLADMLMDTEDVILSNTVFVNLLNYYSGFQLDNRLYTPDIFKLDRCGGKCYVLTNWYTEFFSGTTVSTIEENSEQYKLIGLEQSIYTENTKGIYAHRIVEE
ncbi:MAG: hypothetical protein AAGF87_08475 [Bacteroidota bacterium]